jgi:hypothetical protein
MIGILFSFTASVTAGMGLLIKVASWILAFTFFWQQFLQEQFAILSGFDKQDNLSLLST